MVGVVTQSVFGCCCLFVYVYCLLCLLAVCSVQCVQLCSVVCLCSHHFFSSPQCKNIVYADFVFIIFLVYQSLLLRYVCVWSVCLISSLLYTNMFGGLRMYRIGHVVEYNIFFAQCYFACMVHHPWTNNKNMMFW